jgi:hypothetical protein
LSTRLIQNIGGIDLDTEYGPAPQGGFLEVPTDVAGRAPKGEPGDEDYDPGEGFLAQVNVWKLAPKTVTAVKKED